jgi:hypothetical protein
VGHRAEHELVGAVSFLAHLERARDNDEEIVSGLTFRDQQAASWNVAKAARCDKVREILLGEAGEEMRRAQQLDRVGRYGRWRRRCRRVGEMIVDDAVSVAAAYQRRVGSP